jgi:hypothetical protein
MSTMRKHKAVNENVDGDFYVEDNCCTMCGVPESEAPTLFGGFSEQDESEDVQCYVKKQPETKEELEQMVNTIACAELACIRYCGKNSSIINKLKDLNEEGCIDYPKLTDYKTSQVAKEKTKQWWQIWK